MKDAVDRVVNGPGSLGMQGLIIRTAIERPGGEALPKTLQAQAMKLALQSFEAHLPYANSGTRERVFTLARRLALEMPSAAPEYLRLSKALLSDALEARDTGIALSVLNEGNVTLSSTEKAELSRQLLEGAREGEADGLILGADHTESYARLIVGLLASEPMGLAQFAKGMTHPEVLFTEAIANRDAALGAPLAKLASTLSPRAAGSLADRIRSNRTDRATFAPLLLALKARADE